MRCAITITWERIGRNRNVPPFVGEYDPDDQWSCDALCREIDKAIRPHLGSRFFGWSMDADGGPIVIEGGRSGRGVAVVEVLSEVADDEPQVCDDCGERHDGYAECPASEGDLHDR